MWSATPSRSACRRSCSDARWHRCRTFQPAWPEGTRTARTRLFANRRRVAHPRRANAETRSASNSMHALHCTLGPLCDNTLFDSAPRVQHSATARAAAGGISSASAARLEHLELHPVHVQRLHAAPVLRLDTRRELRVRRQRRRRPLLAGARELHTAVRAVLVASPQVGVVRQPAPRGLLRGLVTSEAVHALDQLHDVGDTRTNEQHTFRRRMRREPLPVRALARGVQVFVVEAIFAITAQARSFSTLCGIEWGRS